MNAERTSVKSKMAQKRPVHLDEQRYNNVYRVKWLNKEPACVYLYICK